MTNHKPCKTFSEDCYNHYECMGTLEEPKEAGWESEFEKEWGWLIREDRKDIFVDEIKSFISQVEKEAYERGKKEEENRWINQPANQHDERIKALARQEVLGEIIAMMENKLSTLSEQKESFYQDLQRMKLVMPRETWFEFDNMLDEYKKKS